MRRLFLVVLLVIPGCGGSMLAARGSIASTRSVVAPAHEESTSEADAAEAEAALPRSSPAEAARVQIVEATTLGEPTEVLGVVDVHESGRDEQHGLEVMRERAAAMHADAVIGVEFHRDDTNFTDLSGLAVRYRDLTQHRPFEVLAELRVHEGEGEGGAMEELRSRARELNADLLIHIAWHDDDAVAGGTYLSGTAIRYL